MPDDVEVRPATPDDAGFLAEVVLAATRDQGRLPPGFDEDEFRRSYAAWTREQLTGDGASRTYVVQVAGERAGRLRVIRTEDTVDLAGVQLLPACQGRGVGTALILDLQAEAVASGRRLVLGVERDNPRARALYERLGFVVSGEDGDEFRMRWTGGP